MRLAYRTLESGEFPIPFNNFKKDGTSPYHSFTIPDVGTTASEITVPADQQQGPGGVNMRFMARLCMDRSSRKVDDSLCHR